jgi:TrmH family RNA methyltransferase
MLSPFGDRVHVASTQDLERMSALKTAPSVLAVFSCPEWKWEDRYLQEGLILVLDGVSDPGNMGTLLRTADWFGVQNILCSPETVEVWNPKVVQATMGSLTRVRVFVASLLPVLQKSKAPILVTALSGKDVGSYSFPPSGVLVLGSESHGVSQELQKLATERLSIPAYGATHPESLNVALAGGICLYEYRKQFP